MNILASGITNASKKDYPTFNPIPITDKIETILLNFGGIDTHKEAPNQFEPETSKTR